MTEEDTKLGRELLSDFCLSYCYFLFPFLSSQIDGGDFGEVHCLRVFTNSKI